MASVEYLETMVTRRRVGHGYETYTTDIWWSRLWDVGHEYMCTVFGVFFDSLTIVSWFSSPVCFFISLINESYYETLIITFMIEKSSPERGLVSEVDK